MALMTVFGKKIRQLCELKIDREENERKGIDDSGSNCAIKLTRFTFLKRVKT
jgi:hypothetical protein